MHIPPKYLKIAGIVLSGIIILLTAVGIFAYIKREALLRSAIEKAINKAKNDYNLNVKIENAHFEGLRTVAFDKITVVPDQRDSLANFNDLRIGIRLMPLLVGNIKLSEIKMNYGKISLIKKDSIRNYDFLFKKDNSADTTTATKVNIAELANNLLNKLLNKIPENMDIKNFQLLFDDNNEKLDFYTGSATIEDGDLKSTILVNNRQSTWHLNGEVAPDDKQFDLNLFADGKKVELPFLEKKYNLKLSFDTIHSQLKDVESNGDELKLSGNFAIKNLLINQPKIAANDIIVQNGSIDADMTFGENFVSIDSSSVIHLKNIEANPFIKYTLYPTKIYELNLKTSELDAQELVNAFPQGLFESLE